MDSLSPETLHRWRQILEKTLQHYADIPNRYEEIREYVIVSRDLNHFLLMQEGWHGKDRSHGPIVHAEIREGKIWIHYDGIEDSITEDIVTEGIPKDKIVLGFHPPHVRPHTGYAVA